MKIVFFDGYCSLCNVLVDRLLKADKKEKLRFASLQGQTAKEKLGSNRNVSDSDTVIYLREGVIYERSSAVLKLLFDIGGFWKLAAIFELVPVFIRDFVYRIVAKNRNLVFHKRDTCRIPEPAERSRLLP